VAAEEDVAVVVDGGDFDADGAEDVATVAAACSPEGVEDYFDAGGGDGLEIDEFGEAGEVVVFDGDGFEAGIGVVEAGNIGVVAEGHDGGFDLLGDFGRAGAPSWVLNLMPLYSGDCGWR